jgi:hypothetical protein
MGGFEAQILAGLDQSALEVQDALAGTQAAFNSSVSKGLVK